MLRKALKQRFPKKIGEYFLSQNEKYLLKRAIIKFASDFNDTTPESVSIVKELHIAAKKIGIKL